MRQCNSILLIFVFSVGLLCLAGCPNNNSNAKNDSAKKQESQNQSQQDVDAQVEQDETPATREELDNYLSGFRNSGNWKYGERTPGELAGTWVSTDGDGHQIVFNTNGQDGAFGEDFNDSISIGLYAISDQGKIVAYSKCNGFGLGSHFQLDGEIITGPKGPNPSATWKRAKK